MDSVTFAKTVPHYSMHLRLTLLVKAFTVARISGKKQFVAWCSIFSYVMALPHHNRFLLGMCRCPLDVPCVIHGQHIHGKLPASGGV